MKLLGVANTKTRKGEAKGYMTAIMHLAPAELAGKNVCPYASDGCKAACLNTAGRGAFHKVQEARIRKTRLFWQDRNAFLAQLFSDIDKHARTAHKKGFFAAVRLNGTSDIAWESLAPWLFTENPYVHFYDYTKYPLRARKKALSVRNYSLVYSYNENAESEKRALEWLQAGRNVAAVFRDKLPESFLGFPVIDGDESDLRFLDPKPCVVGLLAKGKGKQDTSGFVVDA